MKLQGVILRYVTGCSPRYRVFQDMPSLERFVGRWLIKNGVSDDDWIDAIIEGTVTLVDRSIEVEYEDADSCAEPEDQDESKEASERDAIHDHAGRMVFPSGPNSERRRATERSEDHGCEYRCTENCDK